MPLSPAADRGQGALVIWSRRANMFSASQLTVLGALADQASVAITNALLVAEAKRRAEPLSRVSRAGHRIASQVSLPAVIEASAQVLAQVFPSAEVSVLATQDGRLVAPAHQPGPAQCDVRALVLRASGPGASRWP